MAKINIRKRKPIKKELPKKVLDKRIKKNAKIPPKIQRKGTIVPRVKSGKIKPGRLDRASTSKRLKPTVSSGKVLERPKSPGPKLDFSRMKAPDYMKGMKFNCYLKKIKKRVSPSFTISVESMNVLDCWMKGMLDKIGHEAASRMGRRKVLKPKIILRALRRILPRKIRNEAHARGLQALERYGKSICK